MAEKKKAPLEEFEESKSAGRQNGQKLKAYLILNWLQKRTDKNHVLNATEIALEIERYGISAERRSVGRDIDAINTAVLLANDEALNVDEARELVDDGQKTIVYDPVRKGYYYDNLFCDFEDIRLVAECIYAAKFIDEKRAEKMIEEIVCKNISEHQKDEILRDIFVTDRARTSNTKLYRVIETITEAMRHRVVDDEDDIKTKYKHRPEQISFQYMTYKLNDLNKQVERGHGAEYVVSPYRLMVADGNYYLLAYNSKNKSDKVRMYRVDRMKDVKRIRGSEREGYDAIREVNLETYTKTHFGMFTGEGEYVTIRFTNNLLDAVVDRFGTKDVIYQEYDKTHFTLTSKIHLSQQFYGWVFGFGNRAKILSPAKVQQAYAEQLKKLSGMYETQEK